MRQLTLILGLGTTALVAAAACDRADETGGGGGSTVTSSTSSTTTTTDSTTTSTDTCGVDLVDALGTTADCNNCLSLRCCSEAQDYLSTPDVDRFDALNQCMASNPDCRSECTFTICQGSSIELSMGLTADCATCLGADCCDETIACEADGECTYLAMNALIPASRIAGWSAHVLEQHADNRLMRPRSQFTGAFPKKFVPISKRG